ncbi:MAG: Pr6Pr family membrane protein [Granulicella sp.]
MRTGSAERIAATVIAAVAWVGLIVQCLVVYREGRTVLLTLWIVLGFFTIMTNVLVAVVFSGIAAGFAAASREGVVGGTMLSILLVGVIYALLLHGSTELSGGSAVANVLLHMVTPVLVPVFWLCFGRKGGLTWRHPLLWAIYPLVYLVYALARGAATGIYPYPFLNVLQIGWERTGLNAIGIALGFLLSGFVVVGLDRLAARSAA